LEVVVVVVQVALKLILVTSLKVSDSPQLLATTDYSECVVHATAALAAVWMQLAVLYATLL
jgi:hypothetical protein